MIILLLLGVLLLSALIIGGSFYIKFYQPKLINSILNINIMSKSGSAVNQTNGSRYDFLIVYEFQLISQLLECHKGFNHQYPVNLSQIDSQCMNITKFRIENNPYTNKPYEYQIGTDSQTYTLSTTVSAGRVFTVTEKGAGQNSKDIVTEFLFPLAPQQDSPQSSPSAELSKRGRDASRLTDLANLQQAINVTLQASPANSPLPLCSSQPAPCSGRSTDPGRSNRNADGTGWIKLPLNTSVSPSAVPIDPVNNTKLHYTYCSNGSSWEINTILESDQQMPKMKSDGGDDDNKYEIGNNLTLINKVAGCNY